MTGESHIEFLKAGGGAGDNLGDHTATQALNMAGNDITNADVISNAGNMQLRPLTSGGLGSQVIVQAGTSGPTGNGGLLDLRAGQSGGTGRGGHAYFTGGQSNSAEGGNVTVRGGEAAAGSGAGGTAYFGGGPSDNGNGGAAFLYGGTAGLNDAGGAVGISTAGSNGANAGPDITMSTGGGGSSGGNGGGLTVTLGPGGGTDDGGSFNLTAGASVDSPFSTAGSVNINAGSSPGSYGQGGSFTFTGGTGGSVTGNSGGFDFNIQDSQYGQAGDFDVNGGQSVDNGQGSSINLRAGNSVGSGRDGGDVHLVPGNTQTGDHGQVFMEKTVGFSIFSAGTITSNTTMNRANGTLQSFTFGAAATAQIGISTVRGVRMVEFLLEVTNGGQGTLTWAAAIQWAGGVAPTLTAAGKDLLRFVTRDGGVSWMGYDLALDLS